MGDDSVDAVYHSHVLEHLDREAVPGFLADVRRVLREGGIHRVVVPDLELVARRYLNHFEACSTDQADPEGHEAYISDIIEQMVRREAHGTSQQPAMRRRIENVILGDARRRGETHQWMYDKWSLAHVLSTAGFRDVGVVGHRTSGIPGWDEIGLDRDDRSGEYKPGSLYMEAQK